MALKNAFEKFNNARKKATSKLPDPIRRKADDKLGLFLHKYIATLFYFDEEIQEIYWEMEEAVQEGDKEKASQLSQEMQTLIVLKSDKNRQTSTRKHRQAAKKATDKIEKATEVIQEKSKLSALKDFLKIDKEEDLEEVELSEDLEDMIEEVED